MKKYDSFASCLAVLLQAQRPLAESNEFYRMGVIGQFNLTFELAWKALKEVLALHGVNQAASGSPHDIVKAAYAVGWLQDEDVWLKMLKQRNLLIHVYDEEQAEEVVAKIFDKYMAALVDLRDELKVRIVAAEN